MKKTKLIAILIVLCLSVTALATLTAKLTVVISTQNQKTVGLTTVKDDLGANWSIEFTDGTGADEADTIWHDSRSLVDDANEVIDVNDGSFYDAFGTAITMDIVKLIAIKNTSADASLLIGGSTTSQMGLFSDISDVFVLPPGGKFIYSAPDATGLATTEGYSRLNLTHNGGGSSALVYQIVIVGVD